jgi:hypothetical protein
MPSGEAAPFQQMYEELVGGQRVDLNDTERTSAQSAFDGHGVANLQYPSRKTSYQTAQDSVAARSTLCGDQNAPGKVNGERDSRRERLWKTETAFRTAKIQGSRRRATGTVLESSYLRRGDRSLPPEQDPARRSDPARPRLEGR